MRAIEFDKIMLWRTNRQDRARRFSDDFFRGRPPQSARQSPPSMGDNCYQIDFVIPHRPGNLRRRLTLDDYRFHFKSIKQRISEKIANFSSHVQQPAVLLLFKHMVRQRQEVCRNGSALNTEEHYATSANSRQSRPMLQSRPWTGREVGWKENISEPIH